MTRVCASKLDNDRHKKSFGRFETQRRLNVVAMFEDVGARDQADILTFVDEDRAGQRKPPQGGSRSPVDLQNDLSLR
ncbi:MAG: hypothetical protein ACK5MO_15570 [Planctomyces sp.]